MLSFHPPFAPLHSPRRRATRPPELTKLHLPVPRHVDTQGRTRDFVSFWAHEDVASWVLACFETACESSGWYPRRIDSYVDRPIRGAKLASWHSYGLAWDLFSRSWPLQVDVWGPTHAPSKEWLDSARRSGLVLGADFKTRKDFPHVEMSRWFVRGN